jgi:hypothetical protein
VQAYVLVQTQSRNGGIARDLRTVPGVVVAEDLAGPYDGIALARSNSSGPSLEAVIARIRELPEVTRAISAPLVDSPNDLWGDEAA